MRLWHRLILAATLLLALSSLAARELADAAGPYSVGIVKLSASGTCSSADFSSPPASVTVSASTEYAFCARIVDAVGTPMPSVSMTFSVSQGSVGAGTAKTTAVTTDAQGRAEVRFVAGPDSLTDSMVALNSSLAAVGTLSIVVTGGVTPTPTPIVTPAPTPTVPPFGSGAMQIAYAADTGACASAGLGTSVNASVGTATTGAVCVRALDGTGSPLANQVVLLVANSGRFGVVASTTVTTDATGRAATAYTAPSAAGIDNVTAQNVSTSSTDALLTLSVGGAITVQLAVTDTPAQCWGATSFPPSPNLATIQADNQTVALCAFVRNSATNTAIAGANVTFTTAAGYVGAGTDAVISAGADGNGHAATYYRGLGIATVDTITASYGGVTATANVTLSSSPVTIGTPPIVQLAVTMTPEACWSTPGFPPSSPLQLVPADGSLSVALCAYVSDSVTRAPIAGAVVEFSTSSGYLGATDAVAMAATDANGHAAMYYRGAGYATTDAITARYNGVTTFSTVTLFTPEVSPVVTPVPTPIVTPTPTATPTITPTPAPLATGQITTGSPPPPNGGFSFFVFGGGTMPQLVQAAGCAGGRGAFWVTSPLGEFVTYVAGTLVSAVNAAWFELFPDDIPPGQPMMGSCR